MTDAAKVEHDPLGHFNFFAEADRAQKFQSRLGMFDSVERQRRRMLRVTFTIGVACFFFLQIRRVGQHYAQQIASAGSGVYRTTKALVDNPRQVTGMIDVRVGQDHRAQLRQIDGQRRPVSLAQLFQSLEQAAID